LLACLLLGLVLLAIGIVLLLKLQNKLPGLLFTGVGTVVTLFPIVVYSFLAITTSVRN
jgi:hypothetical protein